MMRRPVTWRRALVVGALGASVLACGGEIVGIGNSGNRLATAGLMDEVAVALAEDPGTPQITDKMLTEIFSAILGRATQGDPASALIVLQVANLQRADDDE